MAVTDKGVNKNTYAVNMYAYTYVHLAVCAKAATWTHKTALGKSRLTGWPAVLCLVDSASPHLAFPICKMRVEIRGFLWF